MLNNEVYKKIKRRYLYNKFLNSVVNNKYVLLSWLIPLKITLFIIFFAYIYPDMYSISTSSSVLHKMITIFAAFLFSFLSSLFLVCVVLLVITLIIKMILDSSTMKSILDNEKQEENIVYAVNNIPDEEELLNNIFLYIEEMNQFYNQVDLDENNHYKKLENKIKNHQFNLKIKDYDEELNKLKMWLETKMIKYNISGYDVEQEVNNHFNNNMLENIFSNGNDNELKTEISNFKEQFLKNYFKK